MELTLREIGRLLQEREQLRLTYRFLKSRQNTENTCYWLRAVERMAHKNQIALHSALNRLYLGVYEVAA